MKMKSLRTTHYLFLVFSLGNADKWMGFQRIVSFDGEVCEGTEVAFQKESLKDKSVCLYECTRYLSCKGIFYVQHTGSCTGCTVVYDITSTLAGTAYGSVYYGLAKCPDGWFNIKESCYLITDEMPFEEGVKECQSLHAYPVGIETEEENINLKSRLRIISTFADTEEMYFTAYTDAVTEGTWTDTSRAAPLALNDWENSEPNGAETENCLAIFKFTDFQWMDVSCNTSNKMICEKKILD